LGYKVARAQFEPHKGSFPNADYPLAVIQIDHTPIDLILVDDEERLPIGKAYLTIAIDVYSRMLAGFVVTLEAPSAMSAGLCVVDAILPKEARLAKWEITRCSHALAKSTALLERTGLKASQTTVAMLSARLERS